MYKVALYTLLLFVVVSLVTASLHSTSDGYDLIGFPFLFYSNTSGKCNDCNNWFRPVMAFLDLVCCLPVALLIDFLIKPTLRSKNKRR